MVKSQDKPLNLDIVRKTIEDVCEAVRQRPFATIKRVDTKTGKTEVVARLYVD